MAFLADTTLMEEQELREKLIKAGWNFQKVPVRTVRERAKGDLSDPEKVGVFFREIPLPKRGDFVTRKFCVTTPLLKKPENASIADGGESLSGMHCVRLPPSPPTPLPPASFSDILSIQRMRCEGSTLVLGVDTEFHYPLPDCRSVLTWQVAFVLPERPGFVQEVILASSSGERLTVGFLLSWLIEHYGIQSPSYDFRKTRRYVYHTVNKSGMVSCHETASLSDAYALSTLPGEKEVLALSMSPNKPHKAKNNAFREDGSPYLDKTLPVDGYINNYSDFHEASLSVCLLCHAGKADLTTFQERPGEDVLPRLSDIQGGLVALNDFYLHPSSLSQYWKFHPIKLSVRDTMCFAPAGKKSLASLGETIGIPKIDIAHDKSDMLSLLKEDPVLFFEYAINDSLIALCYAGELWGYNNRMPVTISGASVKAAVPVISEYLNVSGETDKERKESYNKKFRGLHTVKKGLYDMKEKAGFISKSSLRPVSDNARILQTYARSSYHGGYNASILIGKFDGVLTHDYDLENAYASCMALVPDVDWSGDVIANEIIHRPIRKQDFHSPFDLMFGYVKFKFPDSVQFPCIPVSVDGSMVFPRTSDGLPGVYASAPEIYLALCLGAEVWAEHVYVGEYLYNDDGTVSHSLLAAVKQFVSDRNLAKDAFGKKSLPDDLLKTAVCSLYGKTAQDLVDKETWNAFRERMENIGGSAMTSPTHASLTTAGVRCILLAAINELAALGYKSYSVTTDGFITDAPEDVLNSLHLFGFSDYFRAARQAITGRPDMWSEKHQQTDLLNFTTRGNVSLSPKGVCAHNGFVTGFEKDSYEDRLALMTVVLGRTERCHCFNQTWTKFKKLAARVDRSDFAVTMKGRSLSMDFDMKRKPVEASMVTVETTIQTDTETEKFEIVNFETAPYETVAEYERYKKQARNCKCLRTEKDWKIFFAKLMHIEKNGSHQLTDLEWSILFTCIMGYRLGLWDIPHLGDKGLSVKDKIEWINRFNKSPKPFTENTWKDCRKANRSGQMLNQSLIQDMLYEMQSA